DLAKAVAIALLLFRTYSAYREMTLFRIRAAKPAGLIDTILNAKKQSQSKSPICGLANGAFLRLFLKPCSPTSRYVDIDLARLNPAAVESIVAGRTVGDPKIIKEMVTYRRAKKLAPQRLLNRSHATIAGSRFNRFGATKPFTRKTRLRHPPVPV